MEVFKTKDLTFALVRARCRTEDHLMFLHVKRRDELSFSLKFLVMFSKEEGF